MEKCNDLEYIFSITSPFLVLLDWLFGVELVHNFELVKIERFSGYVCDLVQNVLWFVKKKNGSVI